MSNFEDLVSLFPNSNLLQLDSLMKLLNVEDKNDQEKQEAKKH